MKEKASTSDTTITIPRLAVEELDQVETMQPHFSMQDLVEWVNSAVERFYPEANEGIDKRVSNIFTVRTLRHYQTLGCLDAPEKDGRRAVYGFRHYLQALLIRKLLYLRCSPESIRKTLQGKSDKEYKSMLFADLEIAPSEPVAASLASSTSSESSTPITEPWTRIILGPDAEIHLKKTSRRMEPAKRRQLLKLIEQELLKQ